MLTYPFETLNIHLSKPFPNSLVNHFYIITTSVVHHLVLPVP